MLPLHCFNVVVQFEFEFFEFEFNLNLFEPFAKRKNRKTRFQPKPPARPSPLLFLFPHAAQPPSPGPVSRARRPIRAFPSCVADRRVPLVGSVLPLSPASALCSWPRAVLRRCRGPPPVPSWSRGPLQLRFARTRRPGPRTSRSRTGLPFDSTGIRQPNPCWARLPRPWTRTPRRPRGPLNSAAAPLEPQR